MQAFLTSPRCIYKENGPLCCVCSAPITTDPAYALMPAKCKWRHGMRAHRMCEECWFVGKGRISFVHSLDHRCPGCIKGLPLPLPMPPPSMIDLTLD